MLAWKWAILKAVGISPVMGLHEELGSLHLHIIFTISLWKRTLILISKKKKWQGLIEGLPLFLLSLKMIDFKAQERRE